MLADERKPLLAVGMNDEPLPERHGFPVRMVAPGLYGYVSATKWVVDLKATRFADDEGYWTPRCWSERGPIKTASRIDVPSGGQIDAGPTVIAGVAWTQHRGVTAVEVRVDDGEWQPAPLAAEPTVDSWRMWMLEWDAEAGEHTITVRATDGDGEVQTAELAPPAPGGASKWHAVEVDVRDHWPCAQNRDSFTSWPSSEHPAQSRANYPLPRRRQTYLVPRPLNSTRLGRVDRDLLWPGES